MSDRDGMMSGMNTPTGWGPSHQTSKRRAGRPWYLQLPFYALLVVWWVIHGSFAVLVVVFAAGLVLMGVIERKVKQAHAAATARAAADLAAAEDPLQAVRQACRQHGAGPYLGLDDHGELRFARPQRAVLLLGPPRSGKTSGVIIPTVLANAGAAVCTSTKPDLAVATAPARVADRPRVVIQPDRRQVAGGTRAVALVTDQLLAEDRPVQYRAAGARVDLLRRRRRPPGLHLRSRFGSGERTRTSTPPRSRARSTRSTFTPPLTSRPPPVRSCAACFAEIRRATYLAHRDGTLKGPALFALDEVANIAPIEELPQIASEGGGQGLTLLAALQDLSQARGRWSTAADGFLTLFGTKLILPGIADTRTLESISVMLGEYDRKMVATSRISAAGDIGALLSGENAPARSRTRTVSTQRTRVLSPGEIAGIPAGRALHLNGVDWELLTQTPAHASEPWKTILARPTAGR